MTESIRKRYKMYIYNDFQKFESIKSVEYVIGSVQNRTKRERTKTRT